MKQKIILTILFLLVPVVNAHPIITQVLLDPINTESGGEMIQLYNNGSTLNLSGYRIATSASSNDVVFKDEIGTTGIFYCIECHSQ